MAKNKSIRMPNIKRLTLDGVNKLAKKIAELIKSEKIGIMEWTAIAVSLSMASISSFNLTLKEISDLVRAFNKSDPRKNAIKRFLILEAIFSAHSIGQVVIDGDKKKYNKPRIWSPFELSAGSKRNIESEIKLEGDLRKGYLAVEKVVGKRGSGFGQGFVVNVIKKVNIINVLEIKKIQIKKISTFSYLYIIPNKSPKKEIIFK